MRATYTHSDNTLYVDFASRAQAELFGYRTRGFEVQCSTSFYRDVSPSGNLNLGQIKRAVATAVANHLCSVRPELTTYEFESFLEVFRTISSQVRVRLLEENESSKPVRAENKARTEWRRRFVLNG